MPGEDVTILVNYTEQGKSAYEIAVDLGFQGTQAQWLESLKGGGNTYVQDFAQASALTTASTQEVKKRLDSPLPLPTGAATDNSVKLVEQAIKSIPAAPAIPNTLAKTADFATVAKTVDITALKDAVSAISDFLSGYVQENGNANAIADILEGTLNVNVKNFPATTGSTDPATGANQTTGNTSLGSIDTKLSGTLKTVVNPTGGTGYGLTHHAYISLDGGAGTVNITASGDFVAASMGKVAASVRTTGNSWNALHIDTTEECWITTYNVGTAPTVGLTTSVKHRYKLRVGPNTIPVKDEAYGTGLGYTITKGGTLGNTGAIGSVGTPAIIIINISYVS